MMKSPAVGGVGIGFIEVDFNEFAFVILGVGYPIIRGVNIIVFGSGLSAFMSFHSIQGASCFPAIRLRYVLLPWV